MTKGKGGNTVISYAPLWVTMQEKGVTKYNLRYKQHFGGGTIQRLLNNEPVSTHTIDQLCLLLKCQVQDVMIIVDE